MTDEDAKQIIATNVKRLLEDRQMSAADLARKTGENSATISHILNAKHVSGIGVVTRIAAALGTSVDYLLQKSENLAATS